MTKLRKFVGVLILIFFFIGTYMCIEPYENDKESFDNILIVQGSVSNLNGPYKVYLSRAVGLRDEKPIKETNAIVNIIDKFGNVETLSELENGVYFTNTSFKGQVNNEYQLMITTSDKKEYVSEIVKLKKGPDIDSVFVKRKNEYNFESNKLENGIDIQVNTTEFNSDEDVYLKWDYEETWKIKQKWNAREVYFDNIEDIEAFELDQDTTRSCWKYEHSYDIVLDILSTYSTNKLSNKRVVHLSESNPKPFYGYSILISQKRVNKSVYEFWKQLKDSNIGNGEVFDNIPFNASSNIECCNDEGKVIGCFDASYISQKRLNLKSPIENVEFRDINDFCVLHPMLLDSFLYKARTNPAYVLYIKFGVLESRILFTNQKQCVDCSVISNLEEEPDFWTFR